MYSRVQHLAVLETLGYTVMKRLETQTPATVAIVAESAGTDAVNAMTTQPTYGQTGVPSGNTASRPRLLARRLNRLERRAAH